MDEVNFPLSKNDTQRILEENFDTFVPSSKKNDNEFDPICAKKLEYLKDQMNYAVVAKEYGKAKEVRELIERIRIFGYKIDHLNKLKELAVEKEDYGKAKLIKNEIEECKKRVNSLPVPSLPEAHLPPSKPQTPQQPSSNDTSQVVDDIKSYRVLEAGWEPLVQIAEKKEESEDFEESESSVESKRPRKGMHRLQKQKVQVESEEDEGEDVNKTYSIDDSVREELHFV